MKRNTIEVLAVICAVALAAGGGRATARDKPADPSSIEWDDMWESLYGGNAKIWSKVEEIRETASQTISVPFELIVGKGNPMTYGRFPWTQNQLV